MGAPPGEVEGLEGMCAIDVACGAWHTAILVQDAARSDGPGEKPMGGGAAAGGGGRGPTRRDSTLGKVPLQLKFRQNSEFVFIRLVPGVRYLLNP